MKKSDLLFLIFVLVLFVPFFLSGELYTGYKTMNATHPFFIGFLKFAILATMGESIGLRLREGVYNKVGFGLIPRAIVWGFLGLTIVMAFKIFATGGPAFLKTLGFAGAAESLSGPMSGLRILTAFTISITINLIYAPVMMTLHKITDIHIVKNGGTVAGLLKPVQMGKIIANLDWNVQWNFIFKKTIPFFWIPAHTVTFLLPVEFQVLFAALLGIALGVILSIGVIKKKKG
jgi:hypothetical protein